MNETGFRDFVWGHVLERASHYKRADIAEVMQVTRPAITMLLQPNSNPTLETVDRLLKSMDILDEYGKRKRQTI